MRIIEALSYYLHDQNDCNCPFQWDWNWVFHHLNKGQARIRYSTLPSYIYIMQTIMSTLPTKVMIYKAACIITLLYESEAWVTYRCHLQTFHQRCLRKMLHIRREGRRTNAPPSSLNPIYPASRQLSCKINVADCHCPSTSSITRVFSWHTKIFKDYQT